MRTRSTTPLKSRSAADAADESGSAVRPKNDCTLSSARSKLERSRSSLLMTIARGSLNSSAKLHTFSVCTSTPATPSTSDQRRIGRHQRRLGVVDKDVEAGRVDQVDLFLVPLGGRDGGRNRDLARDLLVVEIGDGVAFVDAGQAVGGARW